MKPPADISAEIILPSGTRFRWDAASPDVGNRPQSPSFDTESGRGFSSASVVLSRPTDRDYPELGLLNELILRTGTGSVVYQGRAQGIPVSENFSLDCDGWMSHGEQREITDLIIDRDANSWGTITDARKDNQMTTSLWVYDADYSVDSERGAIVFTGATGKLIPINSVAESAYRAPAGCFIGKFVYTGSQANATSMATPTVTFATRDMETTTSSVNLTLDSTLRTASPTTFQPNTLVLTARASSAHTPPTSAPFSRRIYPAVYGNGGVAISTRSDGLTGFTASDAIRYLAKRWCPKWDTSGVQDTTYLIPHAAWAEPTMPADAIRQLNSYHLWKLGVWEDRKLAFAPYDLSVADWQVAAGVDGVRVDYQGDTTENVYNGVAVSFTDFAGEQQRLTPTDSASLRDTSEWIAANQWGDQAWLSIDITWPCSADDAVQIGAVALASANEARRPSTITVPMHIKDMNGTWWPSSYVRADQSIVVTNQHTPVPRLITRTSWSDHTLTITTDNAIDTMQALNQRISGALSVNGLL